MTSIDFKAISLISNERTLADNVQKDIVNGTRTKESIKVAIERLENFEYIDNIKIDTSRLKEKTAFRISEKIS